MRDRNGAGLATLAGILGMVILVVLAIAFGTPPAAYGVPWMVAREARQAIPPAYTEWIGGRLLAALTGSPATAAVAI